MTTEISAPDIKGGLSHNISDFNVEGLESPDTASGRRRTLNPSAMRELIPVDGLREYWYPAIVDRKVGRRRPTKIKLLNEDIVLFRNKRGEVVASAAVCPHRGGSIGDGHCHFSGTISCPYHGWTFDESGDCVAVLGEGPDSPIPGNEGARLKMYPTVTLKGVVFIWMGARDPAPLEEDIPPQFFLDDVQVQVSVSNWTCNWRQAIENLLDAHVFYVHHNSVRWLRQPGRQYLIGSKLSPARGRPRVVNGRAVRMDPPPRRDVPNDVSYGDSFPRLDSQIWPKSQLRYMWAKLMTHAQRFQSKPDPDRPWQIEEWTSFHLPSIFQVDYGTHLYTRSAVPVTDDLSRVFYFHSTHAHSRGDRFWDTLWFTFVQNWQMNYNFSGQDQGIMEPQAYDELVALSATDVFPLAVRRLIVERARDRQVTSDSSGLPRKRSFELN